MKKYTIYKDDRHTVQKVAIRITKPTGNNARFDCSECGRPFKRNERVLKIAFRWAAPRCICSGCAYEKLTGAIGSLGKIHKKGEGYKPYQHPEWLTPKKSIAEETDGDIPF